MGGRIARGVYEYDSLADFKLAGGAESYGSGRVIIAGTTYTVKKGVLIKDNVRPYLNMCTLTADMPTLSNVGVVNNTASSFATKTTVANNDPRLTFFGARNMAAYSAYYGNASSGVGTIAGGNKVWLGYFLEFLLDSDAIELRLNGDFATTQGLDLMIWIDGYPVSLEPVKYGTSTGKWIYKLAWATKRLRCVTILTSALLHEIYLPKYANLFDSQRKLNGTCAVVGDSFTVGIGGSGINSRVGAWMYRAALKLGFDDIHCCGQATTGFVNDNNNLLGSGIYFDRLATEVYPLKPDLIILAGSVNDASFNASYSDVYINAKKCLIDISKYAPLAQVVVMGTQWMNDAVHANYDDLDNALMAAAAESTNVIGFISTKGWITGTGKVGTTTGVGNADFYTASDGVHPQIYDGHLFWGDAAFNNIKDLL